MRGIEVLDPQTKNSLHVLAEWVNSRRLTQCDLAVGTGVHQSQVSRILAGNVRRVSKNVKRLCEYADKLPPLPTGDQQGGEAEAAAWLSEFLGVMAGSAEADAAIRQIVHGLLAWRRAQEARQ